MSSKTSPPPETAAYGLELLDTPARCQDSLRQAELAYFFPPFAQQQQQQQQQQSASSSSSSSAPPPASGCSSDRGAVAASSSSSLSSSSPPPWDAPFPQWECLVPVSAVPSLASEFLAGQGEEVCQAPSLRALGRVRRARGPGDRERWVHDCRETIKVLKASYAASAILRQNEDLARLMEVRVGAMDLDPEWEALSGRAREEAPDYEAIVEIAFRGSVNVSNWSSNFTAYLEPTQCGDRRGQAHCGFQQAYLALKPYLHGKIDEAVEQMHTEASKMLIKFTGHSMGGALATWAAYDFACTTAYAVECVTFASPPLGDMELVQAMWRAVPRMARYVNKLDPVPALWWNPLIDKIREYGVASYDHPCAEVCLDPEASNAAFWITFGVEAAAFAMSKSTFLRALRQFFAPHDVLSYAVNLYDRLRGNVEACRRRRFRRSPSVGTWLRPNPALLEDPRSPGASGVSEGQLASRARTASSSGRLSEEAGLDLWLNVTSLEQGTQDLLRSLGLDVTSSGNAGLLEVLEIAPDLVKTVDGALLVRAAQDKLVHELPLTMLNRPDKGASLVALVQQELGRSSAGHELTRWTEQFWTALQNDPEHLQSSIASLDLKTLQSLWVGSDFGSSAWMVLEVAKDKCSAIFRKPSTQRLLEKLGIEVDDDGNAKFANVLEKSQQLLETPEGTELLHQAHRHVFGLLPMLESKAGALGISEQSLTILKKIEASEQGSSLLKWGRESLSEAEQDPEAIKKLITSLVKMSENEVASPGTFFAQPGTRALLESLGVRFGTDGSVEFTEVLERSQTLLQTEEGTEILRYAQEQVLASIEKIEGAILEAADSRSDLSEVQKSYIEALERSEHGRQLLSLCRGGLASVREDPEALKKMFLALDTKQANDLLTNKEQRDALGKKVADECLAFLMEQVPSLTIPRIEGSRENIDFTLDNVKITRCHVTHDNILVELLPAAASAAADAASKDEDLGEGDQDEGRSVCLEDFLLSDEEEFALDEDSPEEQSRGQQRRDSTASITSQQTFLTPSHLPKTWAESEAETDVPKQVGNQASQKALENSPDTELADPLTGPGRVALPTLPSRQLSDETQGSDNGDSDLQVVAVPRAEALASENQGLQDSETRPPISEIVTVTARNIEVDIENLEWSFEQKAFLRLNGMGSAEAKAKGGRVTIGLALQRRLEMEVAVDEQTGEETRKDVWVPCLGLSSCSVEIEDLSIEVKESAFSWLYNVLVRVFQDAVKQYVVSALRHSLNVNISKMLGPLNRWVKPYGSMLLSLIGSSAESLPLAPSVALVSEDQPDHPDKPLGLVVTIKQATGLRQLSRSTVDSPWCVCSIVGIDEFGKETEGATSITRTLKRTLDPVWNEAHLLCPWTPGDSVRLTVLSRGRGRERFQGVAQLDSPNFEEGPCQGSLPLDEAPEALLQLSVEPVSIQEVTVVVTQAQEASMLGLTINHHTLQVTEVPVGSRLARCSEAQLEAADRPQRGDYLSAVNGVPGLAAELFEMLKRGHVDSLTFRKTQPWTKKVRTPAASPKAWCSVTSSASAVPVSSSSWRLHEDRDDWETSGGCVCKGWSELAEQEQANEKCEGA